MKPAPFDYVRPGNLTEASALLLAGDGNAKLVAGGQSLGPMLNLRLVQPSMLIDIAGLPELSEVSEDDTGLRIGACVTAANIEDGRLPLAGAPMLQSIAGGIAYRAVRNRGTIGGSVCHADPAADWVSTLAALSATCEICDAQGTLRRVPVQNFVTAAFENVLSPGEILRAVLIPRMPAGTRFAHHKVSRKFGKFAIASGTVFYNPEQQVLKAVIGATHGPPIVIDNARELFGGMPGAGPLRFDVQSALGLLTANGVQGGAACQTHVTALQRAAAEVFDS
jgi:aerobic carbon-monoxide dehydrogenase medium subunit